MKSFSFWSVWGKYYGYPSCCTQEMLHFYTKHDFETCGYGDFIVNTEGKRKLNGTGYIPCAKCNKLSRKQLIDRINKNRIADKNFPLAAPIKESYTFVQQSDKFSDVEKKILACAYRGVQL